MAVQRELFQYILDASSLINIDRDNKMNLLRKRKVVCSPKLGPVLVRV